MNDNNRTGKGGGGSRLIIKNWRTSCTQTSVPPVLLYNCAAAHRTVFGGDSGSGGGGDCQRCVLAREKQCALEFKEDI